MLSLVALSLKTTKPMLATICLVKGSVVVRSYDEKLKGKQIYSRSLNLRSQEQNYWSRLNGSINEESRFNFFAVANDSEKAIYLLSVRNSIVSKRDDDFVSLNIYEIIKIDYEGKLIKIYPFINWASNDFFINLSSKKQIIITAAPFSKNSPRIVKLSEKNELEVTKESSQGGAESLYAPSKEHIALAKELRRLYHVKAPFDDLCFQSPAIADTRYPSGEFMNTNIEKCVDPNPLFKAVYYKNYIVASWGRKRIARKLPFSLSSIRMMRYPYVVGRYMRNEKTPEEEKYQIGIFPFRRKSEIVLVDLRSGEYHKLGDGIVPIPL